VQTTLYPGVPLDPPWLDRGFPGSVPPWSGNDPAYLAEQERKAQEKRDRKEANWELERRAAARELECIKRRESERDWLLAQLRQQAMTGNPVALAALLIEMRMQDIENVLGEIEFAMPEPE